MRKNLLFKFSVAFGITLMFLIVSMAKATPFKNTPDVTGAVVGRVLDESGLALPGANILVKELNIGTATDVNGDFTLINLPDGDYTLLVSFIGYTPVEQPVKIESSVITPVIITLQSGVTLDGEVVVMGDRLKGQAKALSQQYANNNITNIVAADQIGRFPDSNIGDAMKRIPGITMQYDQGEARFGIIRGTSPALNSYMVNGERIPSAEGDKRAVQLDLIPADMIQTIEVNKAITPDMDADAIGGSVNLVTRSAPSGLRISGTAAAGYGLIRQNPIGSGSLVVGNRFLKDKIGVILSGSYYNNSFGSDNVEAVWAEENGNIFTEEIEVRKYDVQRVRRSVSAAIDYKLAPNHTIFLKGIYNHRDDWENRYRLRYRDLKYQEDEAAGIDEVTVVRETKGGGDDRGKNARLEDQRTSNISLSGDHLFGKIKTNWSATFAKASEKRPDERYIAWQIDESATGIVDISNPRKPNFTPTSDVSPGSFEFDDLTTEDQYTEEKDKNFKLNFIVPLKSSYDKDFIKFGGRLRMKDKVRDNIAWSASADFETMDGLPLDNQTKSNFQAGNYNVGQFTSAKYLGGLALRNPSAFELEQQPDGLVENFDAEENVSGGYVMIDKTIGKRFSFVAGVRVEHTDISYQGYEFDTDAEVLTKTFGNDNYTNVFPSLHLRFDATEDLIIRAAWTNSLARPDYYSLVPYRLIENGNEFLGIGNPTLKPTKAMNFDLMAERYFESIGIISIGGFYKNLDNIIYTHHVENYTDVDGKDYDAFEQPRNGGEASLAGFEVALQRQFTFLPGVWKGLGIYANYTLTKSTADQIFNREGEELGLPGTAKNMLNTSLSFESKKLSLRLSLNYTSDYIDEIGESAFYDRYYDKQTFLDFNGSYTITPKWRIFAEANNLTNQPLRYYQGVQERTAQMEYYRQRFTLGVKFDLFETKE